MAPQLMARKGRLRRRESSWMVRATISLPVPLVAQRADLGAQLSRSRHAREHGLQPLQVHGLGEVVRSPQPKRFHGALDARVAGDEDGLDRGAVLQVLEEV